MAETQHGAPLSGPRLHEGHCTVQSQVDTGWCWAPSPHRSMHGMGLPTYNENTLYTSAFEMAAIKFNLFFVVYCFIDKSATPCCYLLWCKMGFTRSARKLQGLHPDGLHRPQACKYNLSYLKRNIKWGNIAMHFLKKVVLKLDLIRPPCQYQ